MAKSDLRERLRIGYVLLLRHASHERSFTAAYAWHVHGGGTTTLVPLEEWVFECALAL